MIFDLHNDGWQPQLSIYHHTCLYQIVLLVNQRLVAIDLVPHDDLDNNFQQQYVTLF